MSHECLFCSIATEPQDHVGAEDTVLSRSESFYLKPALGQFTEGYCLINSINHHSRLSELGIDELDELKNYISQVSYSLEEMYNLPIICFEHGIYRTNICRTNLCPGGCIDHAHMHIIPSDINLIDILDRKFDGYDLKLRELGSVRSISKSYLYCSVSNAQSRVYIAENGFESQFIRKLIWNQMGHDDRRWDWRLHPFRDRIAKFISDYHKIKSASLYEPVSSFTD